MLEESTGNFSASRNVYDWYQTNTHVILNIMIKNLTEGDVKVRLIDETLDVTCQLANTNEYRLHFNLYKPIYVAESSWTVTPSKLEIKLKKTDRKRWQSLEVIPEKGAKRPPSFAGVVTPTSTPAKKPLLEPQNLSHGYLTQGKLKYDWYQNESYVMVSVLIKNLNENDVKVQFSESTVELEVNTSDGNDQKLHLDLFKLIDQEQSTVSVSASKLEMKLKKLESVRWTKLESDSSATRVAQVPMPNQNVLPSTTASEVAETEAAQNNLLEQVAAMDHQADAEEGPESVTPEGLPPSEPHVVKLQVEENGGEEEPSENLATELPNGETEMLNGDPEVENRDAVVENTNAVEENTDAEVDNGVAEMEHTDVEMEPKEAELAHQDAEFESKPTEIENLEMEMKNLEDAPQNPEENASSEIVEASNQQLEQLDGVEAISATAEPTHALESAEEVNNTDSVSAVEALVSENEASDASVTQVPPEPPKEIIALETKSWERLSKDFDDEKITSVDGSVDDLFREIYEKGGEEVRRAMNKNFVEAAGNTLPANWIETKDDKESMPPNENSEIKN
ncbi:Protein SGT1 -like protein [Halotydeus destructor]|nr:Protein SGT1 -like protein [Halotydeus destructor]